MHHLVQAVVEVDRPAALFSASTAHLREIARAQNHFTAISRWEMDRRGPFLSFAHHAAENHFGREVAQDLDLLRGILGRGSLFNRLSHLASEPAGRHEPGLGIRSCPESGEERVREDTAGLIQIVGWSARL
jgi:hypothetical protein